jgi:transcriptional regulator of arginine metabolism
MNYHADGGAPQRQAVILRLIGSRSVRSQEELRQLLRAQGVRVTQPTLSRDMRELGLAKTPRGYVAAEAAVSQFAPAPTRQIKLERTLRALALSVQAAGSLVVVRTPPAGAQPVARALDEAILPGVAGTIAGDDTVFIATPGERVARMLARRLAAALAGRASEAGA